MKKIYHLYSNLPTRLVALTIDPYIPIDLYFKACVPFTINEVKAYSDYLLPNDYSIQLVNKNLIDLKVATIEKWLLDITVISLSNLYILDERLKYNLLSYPQRITLAIENLKITHDLPSIQKYSVLWKAKLYNNALVIDIFTEGQPTFFICEDRVGIITDKDFNLLSLVIFDLSRIEHQQLLEYSRVSKTKVIKTKQETENTNMNDSTIANPEILTVKLFELTNIDIWSVIYYGFYRSLIDPTFCVKFSEEYLMRNKIDASSPIVTLAGLVTYEYNQVPMLLDTIVGDIRNTLETQERLYSKLWFYLILATDMRSQEFIK